MANPTDESLAFRQFRKDFIDPMDNSLRRGGYPLEGLHQLSPDEQIQAEDLLVQQLEQGNTDDRVIIALGELHSRRALPFLEQYLQDNPRSPTRIDVAVALWQIAQMPLAVMTILDALVSETDVNAKSNIIAHLHHFRCRQVELALQKELSDPDSTIRWNASTALLVLYNESPVSQQAVTQDTYRLLPHPILMGITSNDVQEREAAIVQLLALSKSFSFPMCGQD